MTGYMKFFIILIISTMFGICIVETYDGTTHFSNERQVFGNQVNMAVAYHNIMKSQHSVDIIDDCGKQTCLNDMDFEDINSFSGSTHVSNDAIESIYIVHKLNNGLYVVNLKMIDFHGGEYNPKTRYSIMNKSQYDDIKKNIIQASLMDTEQYEDAWK